MIRSCLIALIVLASMGVGRAAPAVIVVPLKPGVSPAAAVQSMQLRANLLNMKQVGDLPLSKQVTAMTGKPTPVIRVLLFCNPLTAAHIVAFQPAFAAYMPCRISLVQTKPGRYELVMMNLAPLIAQIPPDGALYKEAEQVNKTLLSIMRWGAAGRI